MSNVTKKYRIGYWICAVISWLLLFGPMLVFAGYGFYQGDVHEKATLGIAILIAVLLTVISIVFKFHIRSTMFILILGVYFCIENILPIIVTISVCTILDEFVFTPLQKHFHNKLVINKEIDKRMR